jgi:hypothetical protein
VQTLFITRQALESDKDKQREDAMQKTSVVGWVPKGEKEGETLDECHLTSSYLKNHIRGGVFQTKKEAMELTGEEAVRIRITVIITTEIEKS